MAVSFCKYLRNGILDLYEILNLSSKILMKISAHTPDTHILSYVCACKRLVSGCACTDLRQNFFGSLLLFYELKFRIS